MDDPLNTLLEYFECIADALDKLPSNEFESNATVVATNLMKSIAELKVIVVSGERRNCEVVELSNSSAVRELGDSSMANAKREPIMGAWGLCPLWGTGAKPLVRGL